MDNVNIELFGKDPRILKTLAMARNISVTKSSVLIVGEAGVGKRTLGQFIHQNSNRIDKPFEIVDCSEILEEVENKILGYRNAESGRFNKGIIELANGGTLIFANIDCLEEGFQKRIFKIINELKDYDIDIRIIATTTKNLSKLVGSGRFYRGLYTQISNNIVHIPALRERPEDLKAMASYFLSQEGAKVGMEITIDDTVVNRILGHYWTHNIQELKTVMENSISIVENNVLREIDLAVGEKKVINPTSEESGDG
ncbi:MAG: sigma 54-interacting transcriptional regulator, partial [Pseudomonadota bacterium]